MRRNRTFALLVIAVLAIATWLALRLLPSGPDHSPSSPSTDASELANDTPVAAAPRTAIAEDTQRVAVANEGPADGQQPPIPDDAEWIDIRVLDFTSREPIAGAVVSWHDSSAWGRARELDETERGELLADGEALALRFGWNTHTNGDGRAKIAVGKQGSWVFARFEGRYGTAGHVGAGQDAPKGGWVVWIEADRTLRVRVLEPTGAPAIGQLVAITAQDAAGKVRFGVAMPRPATAPDGIAEFRHIQEWLRRDRAAAQRDVKVVEWRAYANVPGLEDPGVVFDADAPPADPLVLHLPPTGRLAARLLHQGRPLIDGVSFSVFRGEEQDWDLLNRAAQVAAGVDGWARFARVALGGELTVYSRMAQFGRKVAAPTVLGEEVLVEFTTDEVYVLSGLLLDEQGAPFADASVSTQFDLQITQGRAAVRTDGQGRFLWVLSKGNAETAQLQRLEFLAGRLRADVAPREIVRGVNDLGVLRLSRGALVVAGILRTDREGPVPRIDFRVEALSADRARDGSQVWTRSSPFSVGLGEDGAFEVRGDAPPVRHRLVFPSDEHLPIAPVEFAVGQRDLVVELSLGHRLSATVLVDADVPIEELEGTLRPHFEPPDEHPGRGANEFSSRYASDPYRSNNGILSWRGLPAGRYTLEVGVRGAAAAMARVEDVVVPAPEGGDPRLAAIDLRGRVGVVELLVTDVDGRPLRNDEQVVFVFPMPQADDARWRGVRAIQGRLTIPVARGPLEFMVVAEGYRAEHFRFPAEQVATGSLAVPLRPWPVVDVHFSGLPELPEGVVAEIACRQPVPSGQPMRRFWGRHGSGVLDAHLQPPTNPVTVKDGAAQVPIGAGTSRIVMYLCRADGTRMELRSVTPGEIVGGEHPAPIAVHLSGDEIRAALQKLGAVAK